MSDKKQYRVKVTEMHVDYVWVTAESEKEARDLAPEFAECEFASTWDCEVVKVEEVDAELKK